MMMPRKKRRAILISVILGILIIIATVCGILYATTDMFKSNSVLFEKYARQLLENLDDVMNEEHMNEMEEILNNNKLTSSTTVTMNYNENGDTSNPINNIHALSKRFMKAHGGYDRDNLQDWMNLIWFILSKPVNRYEKIDKFISLAINSPKRVKYRNAMSKNSD